MCDKCDKKQHHKRWIHLADDWTEEEKREMFIYLRDHYS